jgi:hypothetical protein
MSAQLKIQHSYPHSNAYIVWANKSVEHWLNENVDFNLVYLSPGTLNANEHKQDC